MSRPFLSIAVPTFDRPQFLDQLLGSIYAEVRAAPELGGELEVLVSDNASAPATAETVRRWHDKLPIRYSRHPKNLGGPRNLVGVLGAAAGEYVLFIGDDDRLRLGALRKIRALADSYRKPPVCIFAPQWYLGDGFEQVPAGFDAKMRLQSALRGYLACAGIPAGCIIRSDLCRLAIERAGVDRLLRSNWPQTAIAFIAAGLSGDPAPVVAHHGEIAHISEHHDDNVLYDAWTVWHTGVHGKVAAAQIIAEMLGPELLVPACEDIFCHRRVNAFVQKATWHILNVDAEESVQRFADRLEATLPGIPEKFHEVPRTLIALARAKRSHRRARVATRAVFLDVGPILLRPIRFMQRINQVRLMLRHGRQYGRRQRALMAQYKAGQASHVRYYAHEGY
jgi:hypothetical protein